MLLATFPLVLLSCAVPGGIYREYAGPDRSVRDIAILDWTRSGVKVTHIDSTYLREKNMSPTGVQITIAHLQPGEHTVRVKHSWRDLYYDNPDKRYIDLTAQFRAGHSYAIAEAPCRRCDPFSVVFWIADVEGGQILGQRTVVGSGPYGEAKRAEREKCELDCDTKYIPSCWSAKLDQTEECRKKRESCKDRCEPFDILDLIDALFD